MPSKLLHNDYVLAGILGIVWFFNTYDIKVDSIGGSATRQRYHEEIYYRGDGTLHYSIPVSQRAAARERFRRSIDPRPLTPAEIWGTRPWRR